MWLRCAVLACFLWTNPKPKARRERRPLRTVHACALRTCPPLAIRTIFTAAHDGERQVTTAACAQTRGGGAEGVAVPPRLASRNTSRVAHALAAAAGGTASRPGAPPWPPKHRALLAHVSAGALLRRGRRGGRRACLGNRAASPSGCRPCPQWAARLAERGGLTRRRHHQPCHKSAAGRGAPPALGLLALRSRCTGCTNAHGTAWLTHTTTGIVASHRGSRPRRQAVTLPSPTHDNAPRGFHLLAGGSAAPVDADPIHICYLAHDPLPPRSPPTPQAPTRPRSTAPARRPRSARRRRARVAAAPRCVPARVAWDGGAGGPKAPALATPRAACL